MVYLVTGNKEKFESAAQRLKPFGIELEQFELDLIEPQKENIEEVADFKVTQSFERLNKPVLISDTGWNIPALKGFPGPFMHYISDWFDVNDLINLVRNKRDLTIIIEDIAIYQDNTVKKAFKSRMVGQLLLEPKGSGVPVRQIATFRKDRKTIAECLESNISYFDEDAGESIWTQFGKWYSSRVI